MKKRADYAINIIAIVFLFGGCAYISKTDVTIVAAKAKYPLGISSVIIENGMVNIHREMTTKGFREHVNTVAE